ncbi:hypothetical protein [Lentzea waywayandensis]|uniref:hypothetical protein n=1 Tax=Lentzea waywayandensis TaxID=84724 RepID=UPI000B8225F6|nr:hypothetical protein [Lentzea waywayandensis]
MTGASAPTAGAIARFERDHFHPGAVARALRCWSAFVHGPIRAITDSESCHYFYGGWDEPDWCRGILRDAQRALPAKAARELRALVRPLDELYLTRAIPAPGNASLRELLDTP